MFTLVVVALLEKWTELLAVPPIYEMTPGDRHSHQAANGFTCETVEEKAGTRLPRFPSPLRQSEPVELHP